MPPEPNLPQARAIDADGVAGLVGADATVYYGSVFDLDHLGKVVDVLGGLAREEKIDGRRLRMAIACVIYEIGEIGASALTSERRAFADPVLLECGMDGGRVAFAASIAVPAAVSLSTAAVAASLRELAHFAGEVVVRWTPSSRRLELAFWLVPGERTARGPGRVTLRERGADPAPPPPVKRTRHLGDVDFRGLLGAGDGSIPRAGDGSLRQKIDELQATLVRLRAAAAAREDDASAAEMTELRIQLERARRETDKFKRANHNIMTLYGTLKRRFDALESADSRGRLEAAMKLLHEARAEVDALKRELARARAAA